MLDISNIQSVEIRIDGSYVVDGVYHVPNEGDWVDEFVEVKEWIKNNAGKVTNEVVFEINIDDLKTAKKTEINAIRDEKEQSGFMYDGSFFDSDSISYQRLIGANITASSALAMGAEFTPIEWTLADNTTRLMSAQDFLQIIPTFAQFSAELHYQASNLKSQVDLATTKEEIDAIKWE